VAGKGLEFVTGRRTKRPPAGESLPILMGPAIAAIIVVGIREKIFAHEQTLRSQGGSERAIRFGGRCLRRSKEP